jgi:hypothetical protein
MLLIWASEIVPLLQVLREATANSLEGGRFSRDIKLNEEYPDGHTLRTFYRSLNKPWDVLPNEQGQIKEYYKVKDANQEKFAGDRLCYPIWRRRFIATVHTTKMLYPTKPWLCQHRWTKRMKRSDS